MRREPNQAVVVWGRRKGASAGFSAFTTSTAAPCPGAEHLKRRTVPTLPHPHLGLGLDLEEGMWLIGSQRLVAQRHGACKCVSKCVSKGVSKALHLQRITHHFEHTSNHPCKTKHSMQECAVHCCHRDARKQRAA